ncbi:unnamed protein product [Bursaphelenchus okinawaensis]|uniref:Uncharacterized protein n=1 Tax=Bursaphelenchus okinawaensis TaxID=465554 RepID=A0A811KDR7_9BILA|nr:unnamed protein product [Bursaphelenchus okinawaensis]CAG9101825.1 unnamed protein product [Bursaphelenchus okinawaensis]
MDFNEVINLEDLDATLEMENIDIIVDPIFNRSDIVSGNLGNAASNFRGQKLVNSDDCDETMDYEAVVATATCSRDYTHSWLKGPSVLKRPMFKNLKERETDSELDRVELSTNSLDQFSFNQSLGANSSFNASKEFSSPSDAVFELNRQLMEELRYQKMEKCVNQDLLKQMRKERLSTALTQDAKFFKDKKVYLTVTHVASSKRVLCKQVLLSGVLDERRKTILRFYSDSKEVYRAYCDRRLWSGLRKDARTMKLIFTHEGKRGERNFVEVQFEDKQIFDRVYCDVKNMVTYQGR